MTWKRLPWLLVTVAAAAVLIGLIVPRGTSTQAEPALSGTILNSLSAPQFDLHDQFGHRVGLSSLHGKPVVLTFLGATCTTMCPVVAETLRRTAAELGKAAKRVAFVVISTDPEHDTHAAVVRFSRQHGMLQRWHYLVAGRAALTPIWRGYDLYVAPSNAPQSLRNAHTSATYVLDQAGKERVLMGENPDGVALDRDLRILLGLPAGSVAQQSLPAPQPGHPAPDLSLPGLKGGTLSLAAFRGKVVLLNFWATWCTACGPEMPMLQHWYNSLRSKGFVVLGVDQQEGREDIGPFVRKLHVNYPIALDQDGVASARFDVAGLPTTLLIDRQGRVRSFKPGALDASFLTAHLQPLVNSTATQ
ncbi:MAG TPA: redoxin domain-containing protein [Chloroflexota bacterium]